MMNGLNSMMKRVNVQTVTMKMTSLMSQWYAINTFRIIQCVCIVIDNRWKLGQLQSCPSFSINLQPTIGVHMLFTKLNKRLDDEFLLIYAKLKAIESKLDRIIAQEDAEDILSPSEIAMIEPKESSDSN
tara:strand:- start:979 stop:1365 length:387 start_codon:yes stop_codon:yes gene_type:complete